MKLNADLGESFGAWVMQNDAAIMPLIDMANIACGGHAGDAMSMQKAISSALLNNVQIGAHPSYPDMQGFGRRSVQMSELDLIATIQGQLATLDGLARCQNAYVSYVKPHGALYNDLMKDSGCRRSVFKAISGFHTSLPLMVQASPNNDEIQGEADEFGLRLIFEAFADRLYQKNGLLSPRSKAGAVLTEANAYSQAKTLIECGEVYTEEGSVLSIQADTLCVHGDNQDALELVKKIRLHLLCQGK